MVNLPMVMGNNAPRTYLYKEDFGLYLSSFMLTSDKLIDFEHVCFGLDFT